MTLVLKPNKVTGLIDAFGVVALMGLPFLLSAQSSKSAKSLVINFDGSPVNVRTVGMSYEVRNASSHTITEFQTACITKSDKSFTVVLEFDPTTAKLLPKGRVTEIQVDAPNSLALCEDQKARLAVLSVTFENGKKWVAPIRQKGD